MENLVRELYEYFLMSEACLKYYALVGEDSEAQYLILYLRYTEHATLCKNAYIENFLKTICFLYILQYFF